MSRNQSIGNITAASSRHWILQTRDKNWFLLSSQKNAGPLWTYVFRSDRVAGAIFEIETCFTAKKNVLLNHPICVLVSMPMSSYSTWLSRHDSIDSTIGGVNGGRFNMRGWIASLTSCNIPSEDF